MSNGDKPRSTEPAAPIPPEPQKATFGVAAEAEFSLSQALLAPMDAVLKAQIHAARSFVSFLLQVGFPNRDFPKDPKDPEAFPYTMDFEYPLSGGKRQRVTIPTLALVPTTPLGVSSAKFKFDFFVKKIERHRQLKESANKEAPQPVDRTKRDWFLVDEPISLRGTVAPMRPKEGSQAERSELSQEQQARIEIEVNVNSLPVPAALEKILASLGQASATEILPAAATPPSQQT